MYFELHTNVFMRPRRVLFGFITLANFQRRSRPTWPLWLPVTRCLLTTRYCSDLLAQTLLLLLLPGSERALHHDRAGAPRPEATGRRSGASSGLPGIKKTSWQLREQDTTSAPPPAPRTSPSPSPPPPSSSFRLSATCCSGVRSQEERSSRAWKLDFWLLSHLLNLYLSFFWSCQFTSWVLSKCPWARQIHTGLCVT